MIPTREIEKHFSYLTRDWLDIVVEIHNIVAVLSPDAAVEIRRYGIVYYNAARGGPVSAGICQTLLKPDHIRLAFIHGAFLPDPHHLLQGETFPKRYMVIKDFDSSPWEYIQELIKAHSQLDPRKIRVDELLR